MAVQYDSKNDSWSTWISKLKTEIPEVSEEAEVFFNKMNELGATLTNDSLHGEGSVFDDFIKNNKLADETLISFLQDTEYSEKTLANYQLYLRNSANSMTLFQRASKMASTAMKTFGATLANMGIAFLASWSISKIVSGIDHLINKTKYEAEALEEIVQKAETAKSEFKSIKDELDSTKDKVDEVSKKYAELAQNVGKLGTLNQNQGSLSNDDYQEFLDISNELAELFPSLTIGYDENGNAILDLNGDVQTITSSLYDMVDAQKALANQDLADKMSDIYSGFSVKQSGYASDYNELLARKENFDEIYQKLVQDNISLYDTQMYDALTDVPYDEIASKLAQLSEDGTIDTTLPFSELTKEQQQVIEDYFNELSNDYSVQLSTLEKNIASENKDFSSYVLSLVQNDSTYSELSSEKQKIVNSVLANMGYDTVLAGHDGNWEEAYSTEIEDNLLNAIRDIDDTKVTNALMNVLSGDISKADFDKYTQIIQDYDANDKSIDFSKWFKPDDSEIVKEAEATKERIKSIFEKNDVSYDNDTVENFVNSLIPEEFNVLDNLTIDDNSIKTLTKDGANQFVKSLYEQIQNQLKSKELELDIPTKIDTASAADSAKDAFDALNKALADYEQNGIKGMDIDNLIALNNKDTFGNINGSTASLESFLAVMQDVNATSEDVHNAFNNLASDYIYNSDLAKNITEANFEWTASELKKSGVINSQAVAEQMLINKYGVEKAAIDSCVSANLSLNNTKLTAENASKALENANYKEVNALIAEAQAAGQSGVALGNYLLNKISSSKATITTDGDIQNLIGLCNALGDAGKLMERLIDLKAALKSADAAPVKTAIQAEIDKITSSLQARLNMGNKANTSTTGAYNNNSGGSSSGNSETDTSKEYDWITIAIQRCQEAISRLNKAEENTYANWSSRNQALLNEISQTIKEIELLQHSYDGYITAANAVGLSEDYKQKVQNGTIQIETVTDQDLQDKIDSYQQWWDKAVECKDQIQELNISLSELAEKKFDNIVTQFEDMEKVFTDTNDILDKLVDYAETKGRIISKSYYEAKASGTDTAMTFNYKASTTNPTYLWGTHVGAANQYVYTPTTVVTAGNGVRSTDGTYYKVSAVQTFKDTDNALITGSKGNYIFGISSFSDKRLKTNIQDSKISGLKIINSIPLHSFNYIDDKYGKSKNIGYVAQELKEIVPECVVNVPQDKDEFGYDSLYQVNDTPLIKYLVKAVQELTNEIKELKNK